MTTPIQAAVDAFDGNRRALADALGVAPAFVYQWVKGIRPVPPDRCASVERVSNGAVRCEELQPDLIWIRDEQGSVTHYMVPADSAKAA